MNIAKRLDGTDVVWSYLDPANSRLGVLKSWDTEEMAKMKNSLQAEDCVFFTISGDENVGVRESINVFEIENTPPTQEFRDVHNTKRQEWVSKYLDLLAIIYPDSEKPTTSYRPHLEGPIGGMRRQLEVKKNAHYLAEIELLKQIDWEHTLLNGYSYRLSDSNFCPEEVLKSLFLAAWSFWSYTSVVDIEKQTILLIDIPDCLNGINVQSELRDILYFVLKELNTLTFQIRLSTIFVSRNLYPLPECGVSDFLVHELVSNDINWPEALQTEFNKGEGLYYDTKNRIIEKICLN